MPEFQYCYPRQKPCTCNGSPKCCRCGTKSNKKGEDCRKCGHEGKF